MSNVWESWSSSSGLKLSRLLGGKEDVPEGSLRLVPMVKLIFHEGLSFMEQVRRPPSPK